MTTARDEIDRSADLEERIGGGLDALHTRNRIEDDILLLLVVVFHETGQRERPEVNATTIFWPVHGDVINDITIVGDLRVELERDAFSVESLLELVKEEARGFFLQGSFVEVIDAGVRLDDVAPEASGALAIDELVRGETKVGFSSETRGRWLWDLHERERGRMRGKEGLDRGGRFGGFCRGCECAKELEELVSSAGGKRWGGMGDDIGVDTMAKIEAEAESARVGVGVSVWDKRDARRAGETGCDGRGGSKVGRGREIGCFGGWDEGAGNEHTASVGWTESRMDTKDSVELCDELLADGHDGWISGKGHDDGRWSIEFKLQACDL